MLFTRNEQARSLANYMPGGRLFQQAIKEGSNIYNFLFGLSLELQRADGYVQDYRTEIIPDQTVEFIGEWERAVGIPDDCFPGTGDTDTRRTHVLAKLAASGVQTAQDFEDLAAILGNDVTVRAESDLVNVFPLTFPFEFGFGITAETRFTIIVTFNDIALDTFPYTFPIPFGTGEAQLIQCLFEKLKPANCQIKFRSSV